jgi:Gram-negative bacterial TonB protein C-terminal
MIKHLFFLPLLCIAFSVHSQTSIKSDTIRSFVEFMPIPVLRICQEQGDSTWTYDSLRICGMNNLNMIIAKEMRYPIAAIDSGIQGRVVVSFVVDTLGNTSQIEILKEIGGGCGAEAKRIFEALQTAGLKWLPGVQDKVKVPVKLVWPIRFQITDYKPPVYYTNKQGRKIYSAPDSVARFTTGDEALLMHLTQGLDYPETEKDSCKTGIIEFSLLILPNKTVEVENVVDFGSLGSEFQWEASRYLNSTRGLWTPAVYHDTLVASTYPLRMLFKSDADICKVANDRFDTSIMAFAEGLVAYDESRYDEAHIQFSKAIELAPSHTEYYYYRGTTNMAKDDKIAACADFEHIRTQLGAVWFPDIFRLVCGK